MGPWRFTRAGLLTFRKRHLAGFSVSKKDRRIRWDNDLVLQYFQVLLAWLSLPFCYESLPLPPVITLSDVNDEPKRPSNEQQPATDTASDNGRQQGLSGVGPLVK